VPTNQVLQPAGEQVVVVEDDPQNGVDHVDGHRTVALVISPYTKQNHVDHTNYNQTGMVKTIELVLGLPHRRSAGSAGRAVC
jgi:hypothetical protein